MDPANGIIKPADLLGSGEYSIQATAVSPTINVMCVNVARDVIAPLVYTTWPNATNINGSVPNQKIGGYNYQDDIPRKREHEFLNATAVDDVFRWGRKYGRVPPVFRMVRPLGHSDMNETCTNSLRTVADGLQFGDE